MIRIEQYDTEFVEAAWDQPRGLLDLIGMSFRLWRHNLGFIIRAFLWPTIFQTASLTGFQYCLVYGQSFVTADFTKACFIIGLGIVSTVVFTLSQISMSIRSMAFIRLSNGFSKDWKTALTFCKRRTWWLIGAFFLSSFMFSFIFGLWIFVYAISFAASAAGPGAALVAIGLLLFATLGFLFTITLTMLYWYLLIPILACDDTTFFGVIGRSFELLFRNFLRVFVFGAMMYVVIVAVAFPFKLPMGVLLVVDTYIRQYSADGVGMLGSQTLLVMIFSQFWEAVAHMVLQPVSMFAFGLLYLDLRNRAEGLDLRRKLKTLKEQHLPAIG